MAAVSQPSWYLTKHSVMELPCSEGMRRVAELLEDPPECIGGRQVRVILTWIDSVGHRKADIILDTCPSVNGMQIVDRLSQRQLRIVAARLRGMARNIDDPTWREGYWR